jgi:signal peptidase I
VGDLGVECEVQVGSSEGELILELVEGNVQFQCRFDVATGEVKLSHTTDPAFQPKAATHVKGPGVYRLAFLNVDDELRLWVDGKLVAFDAPTTYGPLGNTMPRELDFAPVGVGAQGIKASVSHLRIVRDLFYIASRFQNQGDNPDGEEFELKADQFFVLGDNSAASLDARYWQEGYNSWVRYVDRDLMIGKALLIYWPHGWYEIPGTGIPFYIPIVDAPMYPNFARMGYVR